MKKHLIKKIILIVGILSSTCLLAGQINSKERKQNSLQLSPEQIEEQTEWHKDLIDVRNPLNDEQKTIYIRYHYIGDNEPKETAIPREMYRNGYRYLKHTFLSPSQGKWFNVTQLVNESNAWFIFNDENKGLHFKATVHGQGIHIGYCPPNNHIFMEYGQEIYYFKKHHAVSVSTDDNTNAYKFENENYSMILHTDKISALPTKIEFRPKDANDSYGNFSVIFDEYRLDKPFDKNNYQPSNDIEFSEGDEEAKKALLNIQ